MSAGRKTMLAHLGLASAMELGELARSGAAHLIKCSSLDAKSPFLEEANKATETAHKEANAPLMGK
eukprot:scaffold201531_cov34-Prasinocladus_malaysianus.AAC.1